MSAHLSIITGPQELLRNGQVFRHSKSVLPCAASAGSPSRRSSPSIVGPFFVNRVHPLVLGLPFLLVWIVAWILLTSLIMAVIYAVDPANQESEP